MTVNDLIEFLQNIEDKEKLVVFNEDLYSDRYASITTVQDKKHLVVLDNKSYENNDYIVKNNNLIVETRCIENFIMEK